VSPPGAATARVAATRKGLERPGSGGRLLRAVRSVLVRRVLGLGAILVALGMVHVWLRLQVVGVAYELSAARQMQLRLEHEGRELEVELATLRDPARIADVARRRLGLVEPRKGQVVVLP
jgi:cell division protein FtsL